MIDTRRGRRERRGGGKGREGREGEEEGREDLHVDMVPPTLIERRIDRAKEIAFIGLLLS